MGTRIQNKRFLDILVFIVLVLGSFSSAIAEIKFPGLQPGAAQCKIEGNQLVLENAVLSCEWDISDGRLKLDQLVDKLAGATINAGEGECFQLILDSGRMLRASHLKILGIPKMKTIKPDPMSCRLAERYSGKEIIATLTSPDDLTVLWLAMLRDGSNYVQQHIVFMPPKKRIEIKEIVLFENV